jgi:hypothetical protein
MANSEGKTQKFASIFGDNIVTPRHADVEEQFQYNINTKTLTDSSANGGTVTQANSMAVLSSGTNTNGQAILASKKIIRYRPGFEGYALFTALFETGGVAGAKQFAGPNTTLDGYYVGYSGTDFVVGRRIGGTDTEVTRENWNGDERAKSPANLIDFTKLNIFRITWGWLGSAPITFELMLSNGEFIELHTFETAGQTTAPHSNNPMLPIRFDITKTSGATNIIVKTASWNGGMMGDDEGAEDRFFTGHVDTGAVSTQQVLFSLENQATFQSKANRVEVELVLVNASTDGTKSVELAIYKNLAITSPSWTNIDATNSVMRIDTAGTVTPAAANLEFEFGLAKVDSVLLNSEDLGLILEPGETYTITGASASNNDIHLAIRWKEHF